MRRTQWLQETRKMRFEEAYRGWQARRLTQEEAARWWGVCERTLRRYIDRSEEAGLEGLIDKRLEQLSHRRAPVDEVLALTECYRRRQEGCNVKHFYSGYRREGGARSYTDVLLDATRCHKVPLTAERLFGWQAALFPTSYSGLHAIRVGALRGDEPMRMVSGGIGKEKVHFIAPPRERLDAELERFLSWFNDPPAGLEGIVRAGLAHLWFVTLYPFEDGNGRLARAITDRALSQDERQPMRLFSLSAQILRERESYYDILECTQHGGLDVTEWLAWFLRQVEAAATAAEQTVANTLEPV